MPVTIRHLRRRCLYTINTQQGLTSYAFGLHLLIPTVLSTIYRLRRISNCRFPISNTPSPTEFQLPISSSRVRHNSENVAHMKTYNYLYEKSTMSKVQSIYHIIISTYHRERTLDEEHRPDLFRYIWDFFKKRKCKLFRINGVSNHIHILVDIHPTIALSSLMRELKNLTSMWITKSGFFPYFKGWGKEYAAFSCSYSDVPRIIEYIKNQQAHHKVADFQEELKRIFGSTDMQLHENDLQ